MMLLDPRDELSTALTIAEAAEVAQRSRRTINRWIAQGRLRVLPGRRVVERELLEVERACRHAARRGRPGPRRSCVRVSRRA